jgi:MarR family transcriptional regulator, lower aerobic nicotinate degradation pathway regulator
VAGAEHVGFRLRLAYQRASANLTQALAGYDITPMQFQTLLRLHQRGPTSQNELGRSVGMPPANIHSTVRRLAGAGLVMTESMDDDRRVSVVRLTEHGQDTIGEVLPIADAANERTLSVLTDREQEVLSSLLSRLAAG